MPGRYEMISKTHNQNAGEFLYRLSHALGEYVLDTGKRLPTPPAAVTFQLSKHPTRIAALERLANKSGWMSVQRLEVVALEREEHLLEGSALGAEDQAGAEVHNA